MDEPRGTPRPVGFDAAYRGQPPPWDIGRPQPALLALARAGALIGPVLDVGCGTGEHALMAAEMGLDATGIDSAPSAITIARRKAAERSLTVRFVVGDALALGEIGQTFETVLDSGLFHVFGDAERTRFVGSLRAVVVPGGRYFMLAFSDRQPGQVGPRHPSEAEIRAAFAEGWHIEGIEPARMETTMPERTIEAWLATITRV
jgi:ubiquinone/menaquinone biosynthesis C-methylase UbiE